jgi:hypothetical protein
VIASGAKIVQRAAHMANAAKLSREEFDSACQHASAELDRLRCGLAEQLLRIDRTAEQTRQIVRPLLYQLIDETRSAVSSAIDAATITPAEIGRSQQRQVLERLGRDVARAADNASRVVLERAQFAVEREIEAELQRVAEFTGTLHYGLHTIDVRFSRPIETSATGVKGQAVEKTTALSVAIGGTLVSAPVLAVVVQSLLLPPVGAFVLVCAVAGGIAITARMIGQRLADALFAEERVERFRQSYKEAVLVQIDQQFNAQYPSIERRFFDSIDETFTALKRDVQRELGGAIEATQHTLDDLRMHRERQETLTDVQVRELERLQAETLRIVGKAQGLSSQLRDGVA